MDGKNCSSPSRSLPCLILAAITASRIPLEMHGRDKVEMSALGLMRPYWHWQYSHTLDLDKCQREAVENPEPIPAMALIER